MNMSDEIKQELLERISGRAMAYFLICTLKVQIASMRAKDEGGKAKDEALNELKKYSEEFATEIFDLITKTIKAGEIPAKEAA